MAPVGPYHHRTPCSLIFVGEASFLLRAYSTACSKVMARPSDRPLLEGRFARSHGREPQTSERRVNRRPLQPPAIGWRNKVNFPYTKC